MSRNRSFNIKDVWCFCCSAAEAAVTIFLPLFTDLHISTLWRCLKKQWHYFKCCGLCWSLWVSAVALNDRINKNIFGCTLFIKVLPNLQCHEQHHSHWSQHLSYLKISTFRYIKILTFHVFKYFKFCKVILCLRWLLIFFKLW